MGENMRILVVKVKSVEVKVEKAGLVTVYPFPE